MTQDRAGGQTLLIDQTTSGQLSIEYSLIHQDQRWAVYDVIVDGARHGSDIPGCLAPLAAPDAMRRLS
jgi:hypothetical protein